MDFAEPQKPSPEELIEDCIRRDKRAWDIFVERYSRVVLWAIRDRLLRFRYNFDESDIEDIHQEVFVSIWSGGKLTQVKDRKKIAGWMAMVAGNATIDYFRRLRRQSPPNCISLSEEAYPGAEGKGSKTVAELLASDSVGPDTQVNLNEIRQLLESTLDALGPKEKVIIKLNLIHGMKHREIAELLRMPINTISTTIARTKEQLQEKLRRKGIEDF